MFLKAKFLPLQSSFWDGGGSIFFWFHFTILVIFDLEIHLSYVNYLNCTR